MKQGNALAMGLRFMTRCNVQGWYPIGMLHGNLGEQSWQKPKLEQGQGLKDKAAKWYILT